MRTPPLLEHTGSGVLRITNYNEKKQYGVFTNNGTPVDIPIVDGVVQLGNWYDTYKVSYARAPLRGTTFTRLAITYRTESTTTCTPNCRAISGNCFDGSGSCEGDGSCGADGTICCGGSRGETCSTSTYQVKNPTPTGFTERYGEWMRIENPVETTTRDIGAFSLSKVEWGENYYQSVKMPTPQEAVDENGNPVPNMPAWNYDAIYFIHYDANGDVVWTRDNSHNPECFTIVQKALMTDYEMWVSHLPPADEGTYEFVISNPNEELVRLEGNV